LGTASGLMSAVLQIILFRIDKVISRDLD